MREHIINALHRRMATDKSLFFVIADVGINLVEKIADAYPDRFLNVGIAEQNMIGVCAGLANAGFHPVTYTISNFASSRCLEQIRDEVGLHDYPVIMLGTTVGFDNSTLGPTHHAVDDWGAVRTVPNVEIHCPSSVAYAAPLFDDLVDRKVAAYVRIPKGSFSKPASAEPVAHLPGTERSDTLVVTYGTLANAYIQAQANEPRLNVMVFSRLRPIDDQAVADVWSRYARVVVVEDQFAEVGLYSTACQIAARHGLPARIDTRAPLRYYREVGDGPEHFWKKFGADPGSLLPQLFPTPVTAAHE
jgi:transketolase